MKLLTPLFRDREIIGPVQEEGRVYFRSLESVADLAWEFGNTVNNIKDFFFPPRQVLYELTGGGVKDAIPAPAGRRVILFARPCDARAIEILDQLFLNDFRDEHYAAQRENTLIIGLSCPEPDKKCFCVSLSGGPFSVKGMDASVCDIGNDEFMVGIETGKAENIFTGQGREAGSDALNRAAEMKKKSEEKIKRAINIPADMLQKFDSDYWKAASAACLTCGVCTYLCPTCHCFDIVDERFKRVRCWDTCSSAMFTRLASGEDHRREKFKRYRQRVYHKFNFYSEKYHETACVGCGRCARYCPVKMDIVEIVNNLK